MKIAIVASLLAALAFASTADANEYVVYSCKTPSGTPAPTDGWSATGGTNYGWAEDRCGSGGPLAAGMRGTAQLANSARLGWGFDSGPAPIRSYTINRDGRISGGGYGVTMLMYSANAQNNEDGARRVDYCAEYQGCSSIGGSVARDASTIPGDSHAWFFTMACGGYAGELCTHTASAPDFGELHVNAAAFTLEDNEQPSVYAVSGSLTAEGASFGAITFTATDEVSGIARAAIDVDGTEVVSSIPSSNGGRCQRVGQAGSVSDYLYRRPCPSRQQVELTLPRDSLTNGEHVIRVRAFDAAGNAVSAFGPRRIQVSGSRLTGLAAAGFSLDGPASIVAKYGSAVRISGTLRANTGEPLTGARVEATLDSPATARAGISRTIHTDGDGRFSFLTRATANRALTLVNADTGARLTGRLKVRSRIALKAARSRLRPMGKMHLTGRIPSERARHGASIAIKVKNGRSWRTVAVARADRNGRFKFSYRFTRIRHATLRFRAVALKSSDLTVAPTPSRRVTIRVG